MMNSLLRRSSVLMIPALAATAVAAEPEKKVGERPVDAIQDNSFLVEEAYNQEAGVVQHILTGFYSIYNVRGSDPNALAMSFTQEWPLFSQDHQVSYTIPYAWTHFNGQSDNGVGDILLNYRYQAYLNPDNLMAFAPRASLIAPTGASKYGFGENCWGLQGNLPFSTAIGDRSFVHLNAGATWYPEAQSAQDRDLVHYNVGASYIYAIEDNTHLMLEWVGSWNQYGDAGQNRDYDFASLISPGVRHAFNFSNGAQLVLGLAAPIGLNSQSPDYGAFVYVSFEHFLKSQKK